MADKGLKLCCSFCGKSKEKVKNLFYGKGALICDQCVEIAFDAKNDANTKKLIKNHLLKKMIHSFANYIILQSKVIWLFGYL